MNRDSAEARKQMAAAMSSGLPTAPWIFSAPLIRHPKKLLQFLSVRLLTRLTFFLRYIL
jgi:hypothetical protein